MWGMGGRPPADRAREQARKAASEAKRLQREAKQRADDDARRARAHEAALDQFRKAQKTHEQLREHEIRYANTIVLLGYGGFFALWATTAGDMPKQWFGWAGVLISISLLLFVIFEAAKTAAVSLGVSHGAKAGLNENQTIELCDLYLNKVQRIWLTVFLCSLTTGLAAGAIVVYAFAKHALGHAWS